MKKAAIGLLAMVLLAPSISFAQARMERSTEDRKREMRAEHRKKMEAQKVAYLTREMELTPEEAKSFWPVYNTYRSELESITKRVESREVDEERLAEGKVTADDLKEEMQLKFEMERNRLQVEEKYFQKFMDVLPPEKVKKFYDSEERFKRELLQKLGSERRDVDRDREMERRRMEMRNRSYKDSKPVENKER